SLLFDSILRLYRAVSLVVQFSKNNLFFRSNQVVSAGIRIYHDLDRLVKPFAKLFFKKIN
ncbi:hypothetical protein B1748_33885, partial [Paenibacillus sp. MY03]